MVRAKTTRPINVSGDLPEAGQWVRLEVPAGAVGLTAGAKLNGWAFTQFAGTVYWDKAGIVDRRSADRASNRSRWPCGSTFAQTVKHPALPADIQKILDIRPEKQVP